MTTFANQIAQGTSETIVIPDRRTIEVISTGEAIVTFDDGDVVRVVSGKPYKLSDGGGDVRVRLRAVSGSANYSIYSSSTAAYVLGDRVVPFTGNRTLSLDDNGKVLRCDDASNVTITVPGTLPECFNVGFAMWGAGTVTLSAGSGATNRSSGVALSTQYQKGSLLVVKNADAASAEYVTGGDFA